MACQNVIGTGPVAASSASTGQGGSCSSGTAVVVGIVAGVSPESGGATVGTVAPPISRIDFPLPQRGRHGAQPGHEHQTRAAPPAPAHPFTAPAVRPRMSWRWNTIRTITIGTAAMTVPAMMSVSWSGLALDSDRRPICTVR